MTRHPRLVRTLPIVTAQIFSCFLLLQASTVACESSGGSGDVKPSNKGGRAGASTSSSGGDAAGMGGMGASVAGGASNASAGATSVAGSGGTAGASTNAAGGVWSGTIGDCGLPAAGASGVAKPSGAPGAVTILNWAGFKGAATYTFDDANSSQIANYPALQALGVHFTFYLITGKSAASDPIWAQALKDGHELGNHTKNHYQAGTAADVDAATTFLQDKYGVRAWTMAAPYGDASYVSLAQSRFLINRGVSNAVIVPNGNSNPFNLPCFIPSTGALASDFNAQIDAAQAAGGWRVVLVHGFTGGTDGAYQPVSIDEFTASVEHAKALGNMWIDSLVNVGAYWIGQKVVSGVTPVTSGDATTWNWTLPANFPPGKCLRVTVPGGQLTQVSTTVPWNDHGYYEIALDAGTLTVSP